MAVRELTPAEAYEQFYGPAIFQPLAEVVVGHADPQPGERVLDLACGTGIVARRVAPMVGADGQVVAVDVNPAMIDVARRLSPAITWHHGDAVALDLPDASFDLVLCQQGLQFFADRQASVAQMRAMLADEGRAVVATWHGLDRHPLFAALFEAELPHLQAVGVPVTAAELAAPFSLGDASELAALLGGAGLRDVQVASGSILARFPSERFVERLEYAYAAVVPQFAEDPQLFATYLDRVDAATRPIVERYVQGDEVVVPMHANIAIGHA
jgi:SAM-dependent methyltransferase